jgi:hypothetical protein
MVRSQSCQSRPAFVLIASDDSYDTCLGYAFQRRCRRYSSRGHPDAPRERKETSCQHHKLLWNWKVSYGRRSREKDHYSANVSASKWKPRFCASFLSFHLRAYDIILKGFPPPDIALRGHMYWIAHGHGPVVKQLANLLCSVFAVLHRRLEAIASGDYPQLALRIVCR